MHGYTQRNAEHVGWRDRGVIAPGYLADLNVIDADRTGRASPPRIVQDLPAGGTRLLPVRGYLWTVAGRGDLRGRNLTGETPGHLLQANAPSLQTDARRRRSGATGTVVRDRGQGLQRLHVRDESAATPPG